MYVRVIYSFWREGHESNDIAEELGLTAVCVRQLLKRICNVARSMGFEIEKCTDRWHLQEERERERARIREERACIRAEKRQAREARKAEWLRLCEERRQACEQRVHVPHKRKETPLSKAERYRQHKERRDRYRAAGQCTRCGAPPESGKLLCAACLQTQRDANLKYLAKKKAPSAAKRHCTSAMQAELLTMRGDWKNSSPQEYHPQRNRLPVVTCHIAQGYVENKLNVARNCVPMPELIFLPPTEGTTEDMKLRDDDKNWLIEEIANEVARAISEEIDKFNPQGVRKVISWLRDWGLAAAAIATPLTLLGLLIAVSIFAASGLIKNAAFQTHTEDRLTSIDTDIGSIKKTLTELAPFLREATIKRMTEASNLTPRQLREQLPDLKSLATTAKAENIAIKPEIVEAVGKKLVEAGDADAWTTAIDFVNYKSFLNISLSVAIKNILPVGGTLTTHYHIRSPQGMAAPRFQVAGVVPSAEAAHVFAMGTPNPDASLSMGNDWILGTGGAATLDGAQLKKVIFRNVYVVYDGGPLQMENVYFLNCTFDIKQQANGERFALALLGPLPDTTLDNSPNTAELFFPATHY